jgi:hypothetical protein
MMTYGADEIGEAGVMGQLRLAVDDSGDRPDEGSSSGIVRLRSEREMLAMLCSDFRFPRFFERFFES